MCRRDFRKECVFTIDPMTARDLDDALSVERREDGNFRVGVHIADVSYFIKEGSALDRVASKRATSVYLVQTVIPMLPRYSIMKLLNSFFKIPHNFGKCTEIKYHLPTVTFSPGRMGQIRFHGSEGRL